VIVIVIADVLIGVGRSGDREVGDAAKGDF
jgi:hypothetical protein